MCFPAFWKLVKMFLSQSWWYFLWSNAKNLFGGCQMNSGKPRSYNPTSLSKLNLYLKKAFFYIGIFKASVLTTAGVAPVSLSLSHSCEYSQEFLGSTKMITPLAGSCFDEQLIIWVIYLSNKNALSQMGIFGSFYNKLSVFGEDASYTELEQ